MARDVVEEIRRATRRKFRAEDKIRIVLEGLRGEIPVSQLCRRESISPAPYYKWSKAFLEAGKNGLTVDTKRDATKGEINGREDDVEGFSKPAQHLVLPLDRKPGRTKDKNTFNRFAELHFFYEQPRHDFLAQGKYFP
jgi:transposase